MSENERPASTEHSSKAEPTQAQRSRAEDYAVRARAYLDELVGRLDVMIKAYREDKHPIFLEGQRQAVEMREKKIAILDLQRKYLQSRAKYVLEHELEMAETDYKTALEDIEEYAAIRRRLLYNAEEEHTAEEMEPPIPNRIQMYLEMIKKNEERDKKIYEELNKEGVENKEQHNAASDEKKTNVE